MIKELAPEFLSILPDVTEIEEGILYISMKYRTINLRCPCGCGGLTAITLHPTRWALVFDGRHVSIVGPDGTPGSIWNPQLKCGSHYLVRENKIVPCERLTQSLGEAYRRTESATALEYKRSFGRGRWRHAFLQPWHWLRNLWN